jgi:mycofactocin precursor
MTQQTVIEATRTEAAQDAAQAQAPAEVPVEQELLIEEISIDGMCGVY